MKQLLISCIHTLMNFSRQFDKAQIELNGKQLKTFKKHFKTIVSAERESIPKHDSESSTATTKPGSH